MGNRVVTATEFKAKCLSLLNIVEENGGTITVTRRGKPVARIGPVNEPGRPPLQGIWSDKRKKLEQMLEKNTSDLWEVDKQVRRRRT